MQEQVSPIGVWENGENDIDILGIPGRTYIQSTNRYIPIKVEINQEREEECR